MKHKVFLLSMVMIFLGIFLLSSCAQRSPDTADPEEGSDGFTSIVKNDMTLAWRVTQNTNLEVRLTGPTEGWVGVGFAPSGSKMLGANIIVGYVIDGTVTIEDGYGVAATNYAEDTQSNISSPSGSESGGSTTISFIMPLDSGDSSQDKPLVEGAAVDVLLAYGSSDTVAYHGSSQRIKTQISSL